MKALFKVTYTPCYDDENTEELDLNTTPYGTATVVGTDVEDVISKVNEEFLGEMIEIEDATEEEPAMVCKKVIFHSIEVISVIDIE